MGREGWETGSCNTYERGVARIVYCGGKGVGEVGVEGSGVVEAVRSKHGVRDAVCVFVCVVGTVVGTCGKCVGVRRGRRAL